MSSIDMCYCVLILSGAVTLIALAIFFLRGSVAVKQAGETVELMQTTIQKFDDIANDVQYKLDVLNIPVESVARFFDPNKPKFSPFGFIMNLFRR